MKLIYDIGELVVIAERPGQTLNGFAGRLGTVTAHDPECGVMFYRVNIEGAMADNMLFGHCELERLPVELEGYEVD